MGYPLAAARPGDKEEMGYAMGTGGEQHLLGIIDQ